MTAQLTGFFEMFTCGGNSPHDSLKHDICNDHGDKYVSYTIFIIIKQLKKLMELLLLCIM